MRESEREKYNRTFESSTKYGDARYEDVDRLLRPHLIGEIGSIIDFGCGRGHYSINCNDYVGVDISDVAIADAEKLYPDAAFAHASLTDLRNLGEFDTGYCVDVMEHLPEEDVLPAIEQMFIHATRILFSICLEPSMLDPTLHLTVKPASWWVAQIRQITPVVIALRTKRHVLIAAGEGIKQSNFKAIEENRAIRHSDDGTLWLPRRNKKLEELLDQHYPRNRKSKLCWSNISLVEETIWDIHRILESKKVAVIGKGPSLDDLSLSDLECYDAVISINEATKRIWEIGYRGLHIHVQRDPGKASPWPGEGLRDGIIPIVTHHVFQEYKHNKPYVATGDGMTTEISAMIAIDAIFTGRADKHVDLYAFDACMTGNCDYAKSIGYKPTTVDAPADRFIGFCDRIKQRAESYGLVLNFKEAGHAGPAFGKLEQSYMHPTEPSEDGRA